MNKSNLLDIMKDVVDESRIGRNRKNTTFYTGYEEIDSILNKDKIYSDKVCYIVGRPGSGYSAMLTNIAINNAKNNKKVLLISSESSVSLVAKRVLSNIASVEFPTFINGFSNDKEVELLETEIKEGSNYLNNIQVICERYLTVSHLTELIAEYKKNFNIDTVLIEKYQSIRLPNGILPKEAEDLNVIERLISDCLNREKVSMFALALADKSCETREDKMPLPEDIQSVCPMEMNYKYVITVSRKGFYKPGKHCSRVMHVDVYDKMPVKNKRLTLKFFGEYQRISSL